MIARVPGEDAMTIGPILLIVTILLLVGTLPVWRYSRGWGYVPGGVLATALVVVLALVLLGGV